VTVKEALITLAAFAFVGAVIGVAGGVLFGWVLGR